MSEQADTTINDSGVNQEVGGLVNTDMPKFNPDSINQFNDIDDDVKASSAPQDDKKADGTDKGKVDAKPTDKDDQPDKSTRYDQDPAWQRIIKERDEERIARAKLEGELKALRQPETKKEEPAKTLPFKDTSKMTAEELREWLEDDPKSYFDNLRNQAKYEALEEFRTESNLRTTQEKEKGALQKSYEDFEAKHKDFRPMWDSGEIMKYMEANPGENPKSAYFALTHEKQIAEAVEKAKKEAEEEVTKRFKAKQKATVLSGGPSGVHHTEDESELNNPKAHGGVTAVLAGRLAAMRRAAS